MPIWLQPENFDMKKLVLASFAICLSLFALATENLTDATMTNKETTATNTTTETTQADTQEQNKEEKSLIDKFLDLFKK